MAKNKEKNNLKRNSLTNKIVSLTVFLDALFLVLILSLSILLYMVNQNQTRDTNASYQNEILVAAFEDVFDKVETDVHNLATDSDIIAYINYVNTGADAILAPGDANYNLYSSYLVQSAAVVDYQSEELYGLVYIASGSNCSTGTDGCAISHEGVLSGDDWKLSERAWYLELLGITKILTNPYEDALSGDYTITYVERVFDGTDMIGYVGIDIYLDTLAEVFHSITLEKLPENNEVIIFTDLEENPRLIYFSGETYSDYFMQSSLNYAQIDNLNDYGDRGISYILENFDTNNQLKGNFLEGENYVILSSEVENTNISVVTMFYVNQLIEIEVMFIILVAIAAIMVFIIAIITTKQVRKALSPIDTILESIEKIKNGNYDVNVDIKGALELRHIGDAINIMSKEINKQVKITYESLAYDVLTGLKNRASSAAEVDATIFKLDNRSAVCLIQVDNLKNINVTKAQMMGDNLIKAIADELKHVFRSDETLFSNGGNEFVYIKEDIKSLEDVEYSLNRLLMHFKEPIVLKNVRAEIKFNVGVSIYPTDGQTLDELIKKCDTALFKAAEASYKKIIFYNEKIARSVNYQSEISEQLAQAIKNEQIYLKYQPLITNSNEIYGFEALARWTSPTLGEIGPQIFIANAEESYLIIPIGTWILRKACFTQVELKEKYGINYIMSVNVSPVQILQRDFVDIVKKIIRETDINPEFLTLEITESLFLEATVLLEDTIEQLHKLGIKLSLDDFGTGYASLTYLRQINFDNLKIDKTFVDGIFANIKDHRIIGTIVSLVHNLDMKVIAEGVETRKQYEYLKEISTDVFQGYIFSKPLAIDDLNKYITKFNSIPLHKRQDIFKALKE
ncbi:MAG: EAL domain-containing protein [Tenericutes bacterium]|nr:EAL domain-containing protein [Mycoplasmatota bacterium]